jgi:hypothetical protein
MPTGLANCGALESDGASGAGMNWPVKQMPLV